jgi:DNA-binding transcriptional regulator YiaG
MPDIASAIKSEIARLSRKETKADLNALRSVQAEQRKAIADLKRQVAALQKALARVQKGAVAKSGRPQAAEEDQPDGESQRVRFSAAGFATKRQKLGLSAAAVAQLLGVSSLSVYKWETGKARPRAKHLQAIAQFRKMGRREALSKLGSSGTDE